MTHSVSLDSVQAARDRIAKYVCRTPLEQARWLSRNGEVFLKLECFQITGSFKLRGATAKLTALSEEEKNRGILSVSAGNHGLGLARAAKWLGLSATIVVPKTASPAKVEGIRRYGVNLIERGTSYDEAERASRALERQTEMTFVSPYNDPDVIAGQGTVAIEILEANPDIDAILVPVGGGGLLAGILVAAKAIKPDIKVYGVEPVATPTMTCALKAGEIVEVVEEPTIADGLAGNIEPNSMTFPIIQKLVDGIILVDEASICRAMTDLAFNQHVITEGSAAAALAAVSDPRLNNLKVAAVLTGRNINLDLFLDVVGQY
ncbi:MAG TPA: threonine/serine dehydratase [Blastocatellia bacterium]